MHPENDNHSQPLDGPSQLDLIASSPTCMTAYAGTTPPTRFFFFVRAAEAGQGNGDAAEQRVSSAGRP
jgi:hypothetical protein